MVAMEMGVQEGVEPSFQEKKGEKPSMPPLGLSPWAAGFVFLSSQG